MFKTNFLSTTKFGGTAPEYLPCLRAWQNRREKVFHWGLMFVQGARHSENLYLIHNMNSICRLCKLIINIFPQIPTIGS